MTRPADLGPHRHGASSPGPRYQGGGCQLRLGRRHSILWAPCYHAVLHQGDPIAPDIVQNPTPTNFQNDTPALRCPEFLRMKAWSANVTRIINRMKSALVRLGIRGFKPQLRTAPQLVGTLRTPEDLPIPPNALDEMRRDLARLAVVREQIKALEQARLERLEQAPQTGPNAMIRLLASVLGVGIETADMLVQEVTFT